ncbi:MAG: tetratricopeptide repeat protein [Oligoflexia bacterium]|nr:tetratricopeptide repeat protein [Oligoflexia bacterium]
MNDKKDKNKEDTNILLEISKFKNDDNCSGNQSTLTSVQGEAKEKENDFTQENKETDATENSEMHDEILNEIEKTVVIRKAEQGNVFQIEKTLINANAAKELKKENTLKDGIGSEISKQETPLSEIAIKENYNGETRLISSEEIISLNEISEIEKKLLLEQEKITKEKGDEKNQAEVVSNETLEQNVDKLKKNKKGIKPIVLIAVLVGIYFAFPQSSEKAKIDPINATFDYPQEIDKPNDKLSKQYFEQGAEIYEKHTYISRINASNKFMQSMQQKRNSKALAALVLVYAELFSHIVQIKFAPKNDNQKKELDMAAENAAKNSLLFNNLKGKASDTIFTLIKEGQVKSLSEINLAIGTAIFYANLGKYSAAINALYRFGVSGANKLNLKYYVTYLEIALKAEKFELAKILAEFISNVPGKSIDAYVALINYEIANMNYDQAKKLVLDATEKKSKKSVVLLLAYAKVSLYLDDYEKAKNILQLIRELGAEKSGVYYARYLEYSGMLALHYKKNDEALGLFKAAITLNDTVELRSKIALLGNEQGKTFANPLVLESKIFDIIKKAKEAQKSLDWNTAFNYAISAVDTSESSVTAKLYLAQIQTDRGYCSEAIKTLNELRTTHTNSREIDAILIKTYIDTYKFEDAKIILGNLAQTEFRDTQQYSSLMGLMYFRSGKLAESLKWYLTAVRIDPLNDNDYYMIAQIFFRLKKFDKSKEATMKATELDPTNVDYSILYANIIYEMDGATSAIGYLESILQDNEKIEKQSNEIEQDESSATIGKLFTKLGASGQAKLIELEKSKLLSEIAIYYHKNGQSKQFGIYKEKIEKLSSIDKTLYIFLKRVSKLEDKSEDYINYSRKLSEINPGDIQSKMDLGIVLFEAGKTDDALIEFKEVLQKLDTFPKVNYFISRVYLQKNEMALAKKFAEAEIKANPEMEFGYLLKAEILQKEEEFVEAIAQYKKAQFINQNSPEVLMGLASINFKRNNIESALDLYNKAAKIEPNNPLIRKELGNIYRAMGQNMLAVESFKMYLELSPDAKDKNEIQSIIRSLE